MYAIIKFENGNTIETTMNGSIESCGKYYKVGRVFNIGYVRDNMQKIASLSLYEDGNLIFQSIKEAA